MTSSPPTPSTPPSPSPSLSPPAPILDDFVSSFYHNRHVNPARKYSHIIVDLRDQVHIDTHLHFLHETLRHCKLAELPTSPPPEPSASASSTSPSTSSPPSSSSSGASATSTPFPYFTTTRHWVYFETKALPLIVRTLLSRLYVDDEQAARVNSFFQAVLDVLVLRLTQAERFPASLVDAGAKVLDDQRTFYSAHGVQPSAEQIEACEGEFAEFGAHLSIFVVANINYFGALGGFERIASMVEGYAGDPMELGPHLVRLLLEPLVRARYVMRSGPLAAFALRIYDSVRTQLLTFTDEELKSASSEHVEDELLQVRKLLDMSMSEAEAAQCCETLSLEFALKSFRCSSLQHRIEGLTSLNSIIESVLNRELFEQTDGSKSRFSGAMADLDIALWITPEFMTQWLLEQHIIEELFGPAMHHELTARASAVLRFMASQGALSTTHLDAIWGATIDRHDAIVAAIFSTLARVATHLSAEHLAFIFAKIMALPAELVTGRVLDLVFQITRSVFTSDPEDSPGLDLLWTFVQDDFGLTRALRDHATNLTVRLLERRSFAAARERYIDRCVEGLKEGRSVTRVLTVLPRLLDTFPVSAISSSTVPRWVIVDKIQSEHDVLGAVIADTALYAREAALRVEAAKQADPELALRLCAMSHKAFEAFVLDEDGTDDTPHAVHMQTRLYLVRYLIVATKLEPSAEQWTALWDSLIKCQAVWLCPAAVDASFQWLASMHGDYFRTHLSAESLRLLFDLMCGLEARTLPELGFKCFRRLFISVNLAVHSIETGFDDDGADDDDDDDELMVRSFSDLVGIDFLWQVAFAPSNATVFSDACEILIYFHQHLCEDLYSQIVPIRQAFLSRCTSVLEAALNAPESSEHKTASFNALHLLEKYCTECKTLADRARQTEEESETLRQTTEAHAASLQAHEPPDDRDSEEVPQQEQPADLSRQSSVDDSVSVTFLNTLVDPPVLVSLDMPESGTSVKSLRERLARRLRAEPSAFYLWKEGAELPDDFTVTAPDKEAGEDGEITTDGGKGAASIVIKPSSPAMGPHAFEHQPTFLLANSQQHFTLLFRLLNATDVELSQRVWNLVERLPTNAVVLRQISNLSTDPHADEASDERPDWSALFDSDAPYRLVYSLRIVEQFTRPDVDATLEDQAAATAWRTRFVRLGGLEHITSVLWALLRHFYQPDADPDVPADLQSQAHTRCLAMLLSVLNFFIVQATTLGNPQHANLLHYVLDGAKADTPTLQLLEAVRDFEEPAQQTAYLQALRPTVFVPSLVRVLRATVKAASDSASTTDDLEAQSMPVLEQLVQHALVALHATVCAFPMSLLDVYDYAQLGEMTRFAFLHWRSPVISSLFRKEISSISSAIVKPPSESRREPARFFFDHLLSMLDEAVDPTLAGKTSDFFTGICTLLQLLCHRALSAGVEESDSAAGFALGPDMLAFLLPLVDRVIDLLLQRPIVETRVARRAERGQPRHTDQTIIGLFTILRTVVHYDTGFQASVGERMLEPIFTRFLFCDAALDDPAFQTPFPPPHCKRIASRRSVYDLCRILALGHEGNMLVVCRALSKQLEVNDVRFTQQWEFDPSEHARSLTGYGGIANLGCTCYMNSLLQQFFHVPQFRRELLRVEVAPEERHDESLLYQVQHLFGFLQDSYKNCADPTKLCRAFKDMDGNPTNVAEQKDCKEFFDQFCDRLQDALRDAAKHKRQIKQLGDDEDEETDRIANLMSRFFGMEVEHQMICKGCPHRFYRPEAAFSLSLTVKPTLDEALHDYVEGEMLEGDNAYLCGTCNAKRDTLRRTVIKTLPNVLFLHLTRLKWNFHTMERVKMNDQCEFPEVVNLRDYTKEGLHAAEKAKAQQDGAEEPDGAHDEDEPELLDRKMYDYRLAGVLVHSGVADSGHYFSFIQERADPEGGEDKGTRGRWYEFNDDFVTTWDTSKMRSQAFGGVETRSVWDPVYRRRVTRRHEKSQSAYILVYERVHKTDVVVPKAPVATPSMPEEIFTWVWQDNLSFAKHRLLFETQLRTFLHDLNTNASVSSLGYTSPDPKEPDRRLMPWEVLQLPSMETEVCRLKLSARFMFEVVAHVRIKKSPRPYFEMWSKTLRRAFQQNVPMAWWLIDHLAHNPLAVKHLMLQCKTQHKRSDLAKLVTHVLIVLAPYERDLYDEGKVDAYLQQLELEKAEKEAEEVEVDADDDEAKDDEEVEDKAAVVVPASMRFMAMYLDMLPEVPPFWRRVECYLLPLYQYAALGERERLVLLKLRAIPRLIDFVLGNKSPLARHETKRRVTMGDQYKYAEFTFLFRALGLLVSQAVQPASQPELEYMLEDADVTLLTSSTFLSALIRDDYDSDATNQIVTAVVRDNATVDELVRQIVLMCTEQFSLDEMGSVYRLLFSLLALEDSLQEQRIIAYLNADTGLLAKLHKFRRHYPGFAYAGLEFCLALPPGSPAAEFIKTQQAKMQWVLQWLPKHVKKRLAVVRRRAEISSYTGDENAQLKALQQEHLLQEMLKRAIEALDMGDDAPAADPAAGNDDDDDDDEATDVEDYGHSGFDDDYAYDHDDDDFGYTYSTVDQPDLD